MAEYQERRALFDVSLAKVLHQNQLPQRRWSAAINAFSDRTSAELGRLRGWRRRGSPSELPRHDHGVHMPDRSSSPNSEKSVSFSQMGPGASRATLLHHPERV